jgi:hypothetical protein
MRSGVELGRATGRAVGSLWEMKSGYAICSRVGLEAISKHFEDAPGQ